MPMSREEMREVAEEAADKALIKFMLALGIDATNPQAIIEAQAHMNHLRRNYDACQTVQKHGIKWAVGTVLTSIAGYVLIAFGLAK